MCYPVQIKKVKEEISEASKNPTALILEGLHSAGYKGALANPLMAPESALDSLDASIVEQFVAVSIRNIYIMIPFLSHL